METKFTSECVCILTVCFKMFPFLYGDSANLLGKMLCLQALIVENAFLPFHMLFSPSLFYASGRA
ncbi:hypothetical protein BJ741DRAFT_631883 [Chytriomyces cf. hyalinus JEL632]|nr:hypothetical protein BJ741DRAFT_631883 [Chytriomyces cf. hyalinus JEL632]